jgi:hypothetical protein
MYEKLREMKFELKVESMDEVLQVLVKEHKLPKKT